MTTEIRIFKNIGVEEMVEAFNLSFSDYFVPLRVTAEQLQNKMRTENICFDYSVGAFDGEKLIGFILHFIENEGGIKKVYNGGTGVIPGYRGNGLTKKMYDFVVPRMKEDQVDHVVLEALNQNIQAIKSYKKVGFTEKRELYCFSGKVDLQTTANEELQIKALQSYDWEAFLTFWDILPSWQNAAPVLEKLLNQNISYGAYINNTIVGYIIYNPDTKRVQQLAVHKNFRRKGIATKMLSLIVASFGNPVTFINVDKKSAETTCFLNKMGLKHQFTQTEFIYNLMP